MEEVVVTVEVIGESLKVVEVTGNGVEVIGDDEERGKWQCLGVEVSLGGIKL